MGLFGKKKSKDSGDYTDVEAANANLPVAVAVYPDANSARPPLPSAPPQGQVQQAALMTLPAAPPLPNQQQQTKQPQFHQVAVPPPQPQQSLQAHLVLSRDPVPLQPCMHCGRNGRTRVTTSPNWVTWCLVGLLLFLFWPLFFLPLVMNSTRRSVHRCNMCDEKIAVIQPCEDCCVKHR
mmetsp:Transcript_19325/g.36482  ORF Transcript_19325/g.36482 Transcript_19325/m.36482 type:complete len:179 (-) Transcript_19325:137-673(-)|eukprot:scaffold12086_cov160-Amphora_coffeaeformis.AAC.8